MNVHQLSQREKEVLELITYENTNDEIAQQLYISYETVKTHRKKLLEKLSVKNTAGLVRRGFELGFLSLPPASIIDQHH
jgi:DNA-binding CsgD family transcriptional regulator